LPISRFASRHGFSHADFWLYQGHSFADSKVCIKARLSRFQGSYRARLSRFQGSYQGTASAVPQESFKKSGLSR